MKESPAKDGDVPIDGSKPEKRQRDKRLRPDHEKEATQPSGWLRKFNQMANGYWPKGSSEQPLPTLTDEISRFTNKYIYIFSRAGCWPSQYN